MQSEVLTPKPKRKRTATGISIRVPKKFKNHEPRLEFHSPPKEDIEAVLPAPEDEAARHKFPPPKKHPEYRDTWMKYIDSVARRENFHTGHLEALKILCDLHVEYFELGEWIRKNGRSYCSVGRQGEVWKLYPEVGLYSKVNAQIKEYMKLLGLSPKRDHGTESGGEGGKWE